MPDEWRCSGCRTLLGIEKGGKLFLRYKQVQYVVIGEVIAICRTCGLANEHATPPRALPVTNGESPRVLQP